MSAFQNKPGKRYGSPSYRRFSVGRAFLFSNGREQKAAAEGTQAAFLRLVNSAVKIVLMSALLGVFCFTTAAAAEGPYLGAGLAVDSFTGSHDKYLSPGSGLDLKVGYRSGLVALEGDWVSSGHNDKDPGFVRADFYGLSLDVKVFGPYLNEHNQLYGLLGVGRYAINEYPYGGSRTALRGNGMNLGVGVEHYLNGRCLCNIVSLNLGLTYRIIKYGNPDTGTVSSALANDKNGDMLTVEAGVFFHF